jgi:phage-related protein
LVYFVDDYGGQPIRLWLMALRLRDRRALTRCSSKLRQLAELGFEARRPLVDHLGGGIYELRVRNGRIQYRILYSFGRQNEIVVLHAIQKESVVPIMDIRRAEHRRDAYLKDPDRHGYEEEIEEEDNQED